MNARRVAGAAMVATLFVTTVGLPPAAAQAQARLDLVAQTTYVGDDPAVIDVRVLGAPAGATLRARLHEAVTTRSALAASIAGRPRTAVIGEWPVPNIDEVRVGAGDVISLQVPDEEIGLLLRRPTDAGPHPLIIELLDGDEVLDTLVTHLLVVPPGTTRRITVALVLDLGVPLSIIPDGSSAPDEAALDRAVGLAEVLAARVELPVTVRLTPETFETLSEAGSEGSLELLRAAAVGNSVLLTPWVDIDAEAWRRGGRSDIVSELYTRGREVLSSVALAEPNAVVALDDTATPATLAMLAAEPIGATGFILGDGVANVPEEMAGSLVVADSDGANHPAVVPDRFLANLMAGPDPELAVHDTLAELLRMALTGDADPAGVVIAPSELDLFALDLLLEGLDRPSPLVPGTIESVLAIPFAPRASGLPLEARLEPATPDDLTAHIAARNELEPRLAAYTSMVTDPQEPAALLRTILAASTSQAAAGTRSAYLDTVRQQVDAGLEGVSLIDSGRITITSRRAALPIRIHNNQSVPINVALTLSAEKVDFPGGGRRLMVLAPGDNELPVEVLALASGDSVINLTIESPEGGVELAVGVVRLRSTAISGLGLLISVIALAVLLSWWVKTVLRGRRSREDAPDIVAAAADQPGHEPGEGPHTAEDHQTAEGAP